MNCFNFSVWWWQFYQNWIRNVFKIISDIKIYFLIWNFCIKKFIGFFFYLDKYYCSVEGRNRENDGVSLDIISLFETQLLRIFWHGCIVKTKGPADFIIRVYTSHLLFDFLGVWNLSRSELGPFLYTYV